MSTQSQILRKTLGVGMEKWITIMLNNERISYIPSCRVINMEGGNELERITFHKDEDISGEDISPVDYYIKPDMVIVENGIARPRKELV